ncbi:MAG TPA: tRNA pseudouridine(55) synthase TruB [Erysipelotrichaceae bacterium]|nr:tRNA pseudouridine(55) synthase TruB [Erysipelotrichaceae bacterium]
MKNGFLLIDKEIDFTSRDVCNIVSKRFNARKVGHSGTLDPFATGLLIVGINGATKTLSFLESQFKTYEASLLLGSKTDSGDLSGQTVETAPVPSIEIKDIKEVFSSLEGRIEQEVPLISAVRVKGKRLYEYARENEEVELPTRSIDVLKLELISFKDNVLTFKAVVSKGTYIRALGETIAEKLNTLGHLIYLRRTKILDMDVSMAKKVKEVDENDLIPTCDILRKVMPVKVITHKENLKKAQHGGKLSLKIFEEKIPLFCVSDDNNNYIAIYEYCDLGYYKCVRGYCFENH